MEYTLDTSALIKTQLGHIEAEAARHTRLLLAAEDAFISAHRLVDRLKAHGAGSDLTVALMYHMSDEAASVVLFPTSECANTVVAIFACKIKIVRIRRGYSEDVCDLTLDGYDNVHVYVARSSMTDAILHEMSLLIVEPKLI